MDGVQPYDIPGDAKPVGSYAVLWEEKNARFRLFFKDTQGKDLGLLDFSDLEKLDRVLEMISRGSVYFTVDTNIESNLLMTNWLPVA